MSEHVPHNPPHHRAPPMPRRRPWIPVGIAAGVAILLGSGGWMVMRAEAKTNKVALSSSAKPVAVIAVKGTPFRDQREYVGTIEPWVEAKVGPQLVSAYVDTVLVRPGAKVNKGDVVATLDCRDASATAQAVAMQARAVSAQQQAVANEAARVRGLLDGGFVSPNDVEQKEAQSASEQAQLLATRARLLGSSLEVNDCILRAPFDGEVSQRMMDPGAFARPGTALVSVVDRSTVRVTGDAPEVDFDVVAPGTKVHVHVLSTEKDISAVIARRAPAADPATRTVHFELDVPDPDRQIPVGTTAELRIDVGQPRPAVAVPLAAAVVRGQKVSVFVVQDGVARKRVIPLEGERDGVLYVDPKLAPGSQVVIEGRDLLNDKDRVAATVEKVDATAGAKK